MEQKISVFLSSHTDLSPSFEQATRAVGAWMGQNGHTLVYGGARKGLMEILAQTVREYGGRVYGVVPQILVDRGAVSEMIDITFHCADLNDRKAIMVRESDWMIALPGGIGTLDEIFTVLAADTIGLERKHVVLYNVEGYWNPLIRTLQKMSEGKLVSNESLSWLHVVESIEELQVFSKKHL